MPKTTFEIHDEVDIKILINDFEGFSTACLLLALLDHLELTAVAVVENRTVVGFRIDEQGKELLK